MYGKHFASMYTGSMVGSGAIVFAVWGYVIANARPDADVGTQVELNPRLLATILGETVPAVQGAIDRLCSPDAESRTKECEGKRLVRLGQFDYQVVNGEKYRRIRDEEMRREANREYQRKHRARRKDKNAGKPLPGETAYVRAFEERGQEYADTMPPDYLASKA
jgi:hypothetical protein